MVSNLDAIMMPNLSWFIFSMSSSQDSGEVLDKGYERTTSKLNNSFMASEIDTTAIPNSTPNNTDTTRYIYEDTIILKNIGYNTSWMY